VTPCAGSHAFLSVATRVILTSSTHPMIALAHLQQGCSMPLGLNSVGTPCAGSHAFPSVATRVILTSSTHPMIALAHLEVASCCRPTCLYPMNGHDWRMASCSCSCWSGAPRRRLALPCGGLLLMLACCHIQRHQYSVGDDAAPRLGEALDSGVAKVLRKPSCSKARCPSNSFVLDFECPGLLTTLNNRSH